ncbi:MULTISPECIES: TetR/AcrR family transcriptional regulator [Kitasatospora]|uniref:Putative TetR family transcriptional regulator n=1 Tax=Kitasatospora setae (strain ATCC 33774 / DSM 43861 / JCM 3304 / KCC A-0304 / NBRC 14216 / KM-6054) TaxID=452652 RepID=E4N531_KITSK|nr:TetR/AcrR family transcriptional regulator [Kitasatospora setae]BAJ26312.1 putative TetR family transcriptional regulator [Kitasatospora setae KM-6054]
MPLRRIPPASRSKISPAREREFFEAVLDEVRTHGYQAVTMEGVAARTRCGKSTLYRHWGGKARLVAAALRAGREPRCAGIDTGSLAGDLRRVAAAAGAWSDHDTSLLQALGYAVMTDSDLRDAVRETVIAPELAALEALLRRGVRRGEVAADHPALEFVPGMIFGMTRIRPLFSDRPADAAYLARYVEAAVLPALGLT